MTITQDGLSAVSALLGVDTTSGTTAFEYISIGSSVTSSASTDTGLGTQEQIAAATGTQVTTTVTNDTLQLVKDAFSFGSATVVYEVGVFNGATGSGTDCMLSRATFAAVNVTANDTLKVTVKIECNVT